MQKTRGSKQVRVTKQAEAGSGFVVDEQELKLINRWSRKELSADEIYAFGVRLCDNEIDRDGERFTEKTLEELAELFVGKSGVFDHQWSAKGQAARIYRTELVHEEGQITGMGDVSCYLKGYAYMLRTEGNKDLIAEIEGGIKKEVSVGCAVGRRACSICGGESGICGHEVGEVYEGKQCCVELLEAKDAYEWSFVAVPAQRKAGVVKGLSCGEEELERLKKEAAMGRRYLTSLRQEVARLGGMTQKGLDAAVLRSVTAKLDEHELLALKGAFEEQMREMYPMEPQLTDSGDMEAPERDRAFLI